MIVPQMLTAAWVNFFFTGFVVGKVPFPLTQRFRGMLQRGIELQSLDVTYISSLSWYFLNFFGLRGVFALALGKNDLNDAQAMQQQMAMGMDTGKAFVAVKESLDMMDHEFQLHVAERRAGGCSRNSRWAPLRQTPGDSRTTPNSARESARVLFRVRRARAYPRVQYWSVKERLSLNTVRAARRSSRQSRLFRDPQPAQRRAPAPFSRAPACSRTFIRRRGRSSLASATAIVAWLLGLVITPARPRPCTETRLMNVPFPTSASATSSFSRSKSWLLVAFAAALKITLRTTSACFFGDNAHCATASSTESPGRACTRR